MSELKPIYLFADSGPLFWVHNGVPFLRSIRDHLESPSPKAAYIGASNGDDPVFFSIFEAAMVNIGIQDARMIRSSFSEEDRSFLDGADIVLLAGGDAEVGWNTFKKNGLNEILVQRYGEGALMMGVSAGAAHLGMVGWSETDQSAETLFQTLGLVPMIISAHDEDRDWERLKMAVTFMGDLARGLGIPKGGGVVFRPDLSLEPLRHPVYEFFVRDGKLVASLIYPGGDDDGPGSSSADQE